MERNPSATDGAILLQGKGDDGGGAGGDGGGAGGAGGDGGGDYFGGAGGTGGGDDDHDGDDLPYGRCYIKSSLTGTMIEFPGTESGPKPCKAG